MAAVSPELISRSVLERYPAPLRPLSLASLGNRGGFSGARLWRVRCEVGDVCLRAWPPHVSPQSIAFQHGLMHRAREAGLTFVPVVYCTKQGPTWVEHAGRCWEATSWQPGRADFEANPSPARLRTASSALARVHEVWAGQSTGAGSCPAIQRRLARAAEWLQLTGSGWRAPLVARPGDWLRSQVEKAWFLLADQVQRVPGLLAPFDSVKVPLQPCLCDVWHDHLLFEGDTLTGLVDFGGVKIDYVSVDLARMLGSLVGGEDQLWSVGLEAYREVRAFSAREERLAQALDVTGTIVGLVNWLLWIYRDGMQYEDWHGVARRMAYLIRRIEPPN